MKLKKAILLNRAPFENLNLNFDESNVFVLSGINGKGKTTFISLIVDSIYEFAKKAYNNEFENKSNKFYRIVSDVQVLDKNKASIMYLRFEDDDGNNIDYVDIIGNFTQEEYDSQINITNKIDYKKISSRIKNDGFIKYCSIEDRKVIRDKIFSNLCTYFPSYRYETPLYLNDPYKISIDFNLDSEFNGYLPNPLEVVSDIRQIAKWIMDVILDGELYKDFSTNDIRNTINQILNRILSSKIKEPLRLGIGPRTSMSQRIAITTQGGKIIYPSIFGMSSGELSLVCIFIEIVKQADKLNKTINNVSGIVLIDEIDKHLHIKLQKEILPKLFKLFPRVQFVVSSHSPFFALGLHEESLTYTIFDFDKNGMVCLPQNNGLFKEVYEMFINENERYYQKYLDLKKEIQASSKPLVITEGKTDWKHLKAAKEALSITDVDVDFYESQDSLGDTALLSLLKDYAKIYQARKIIGVFDRDNDSILKELSQETQTYVDFGNNVYAFIIPLVNEQVYGDRISIEHYYKKNNLLKFDDNGRRIFLGCEFYTSGISKDTRYITRCKGVQNKVKHNGIIDDKVYIINDDPEEKKSIAMSKNDFADKIYLKQDFAQEVDFSEFDKIFHIIKEICEK